MKYEEIFMFIVFSTIIYLPLLIIIISLIFEKITNFDKTIRNINYFTKNNNDEILTQHEWNNIEEFMNNRKHLPIKQFKEKYKDVKQNAIIHRKILNMLAKLIEIKHNRNIERKGVNYKC